MPKRTQIYCTRINVEHIYIEDYEGLYEITKCGKVYGVKRNRYLKEGISRDGYARVSLCKDNCTKSKSIHRLVAKHFLNNPSNKPQVNHINGKKYDNRLENLEWCNQSENQIHAFKIGLQVSSFNQKRSDSIKIRNKIMCSKKVLCLSTGYIFESAAQLSRDLNLHYAKAKNLAQKGIKYKYLS